MAQKDDTKTTITSERLQNVIQALSFASVDEFESCIALLEKSEEQDEFKELETAFAIFVQELSEAIVNRAGRTGGTFLHTSRTRPSHLPRQRVPPHLTG